MTAGALVSLSQIGGKVLTLTYSTVILVQSGVADPFNITILVFLLQFLGAIVSPIIVDKIGRRPIALTGFGILFIVDMAADGLAYAELTERPHPLGLASLCIIFTFVNSAFFQSLYVLPLIPKKLKTDLKHRAFLLPTKIPTSRLRNKP
jgi:MFS family permease